MPRSKSGKWKKDRAWLREALKDASSAPDWSAERTAEVEERLKQILLRTLAAPTSDRTSYFVGYEATEVLLAMEAAKQDRELAAFEALRRPQIVVTVNF